MAVLSDRHVPLAVWVAQPARTNVRSGLTVESDASGVLAVDAKVFLLLSCIFALFSIQTQIGFSTEFQMEATFF